MSDIIPLLTKTIIDNHILVKSEIENSAHGILSLNKWAIPHWDCAKQTKIGSIKISKTTAEYIINRLIKICPEENQKIQLIWLNYGWSIDNTIPEWSYKINFTKIEYIE